VAAAFLLIPVVLIFSIGPGMFFVRRLRWKPLEKIAGAIALSLILLFVLTFGVYIAGLPKSAYWAISAGLVVLTAVASPSFWRLCQYRDVRLTLATFGVLVAWTVGAQALIRHYSGADWCCDWVEHYQRSRFFLDRWPADFQFIGRYPLTGRPPLMNVVAAYFLGIVADPFWAYQIIFSLLNLVAFFPCCLLAQQFSPGARRVPLFVGLFLAVNPMFFVNTTFAWTKVLAAFFVLLAIWLFLAGRRKQDAGRIAVALLCLAAGTLVHFSSAPYAILLGGYCIWILWTVARTRLAIIAAATTPALVLGAIWIVWAVQTYGGHQTFAGNVTVQAASALTPLENIGRITLNTFHTFWPYIFPGGPDDSSLRLLIDRAFAFYQENFLGAMGSAGAYVVLWLVWRDLVASRPMPRFEQRFWMAFLPLSIFLGIAVDSEVTPSGFANIGLQPLVYMAVALLAGRFAGLSRPLRIVLWCAMLLDFVLGVVLELYMESQVLPWARSPNFDWKREYQLIYLGDRLIEIAPLVEAFLIVTAVSAFVYLGRVAIGSALASTQSAAKTYEPVG
jgi:hypothetical protein